MKTTIVFSNNNGIKEDFTDTNTNTTIDRVECERNVCQNELYRLRDGLKNVLANSSYNYFKLQNNNWIDRYCPCCRRSTKNRNFVNIR